MRTRALLLSAFALFATGCRNDKPPAAQKPGAEVAASGPAMERAPAAALATIAIPDARSTIDRVLTGGQPTEEHLQQAKDAGVKVVVNLRSADEEEDYASAARKVEALGMKYVHIPIHGSTGEGLHEANARKLGDILATEPRPMIIHCRSGQRVGALLALKAFYVDKASPDVAMQIGKANGMSKPALEKVVADQMATR